MGILNVTPDSFSDGGSYFDTKAAIARGLEMGAIGADIIDVGGESTRPGAQRTDAASEMQRVVPVIEALVNAGLCISVDTMRSAVAQAALAAGASIVNDVSGGLNDARMAEVVADAGCHWVLMHWRGHSGVMADLAHYDDVVKDVSAELCARADAAVAKGVDAHRIILDPGLGFAKTAEHNWRLNAHLDDLVSLGYPVLYGASRKSFLGAVLTDRDGAPRDVHERDFATVATTVLAAAAGVWGVRVHDVLSTMDALRVCEATTRHRDAAA